VLPFLVILGAFYLLIIRPARSRQKAQQQLLNTMEVGSRVVTTSGIFAEVAAMEDNAVLLEVAPGVTLRFAKPAVARILPEPEPDEPADEEPEQAADASTDQDSTDRPA
jgi:preprotein translocase subunit YajC